MPAPSSGEYQDKFIERCMSDPESRQSFPDADQRFAFCSSQWERCEDGNRGDFDFGGLADRVSTMGWWRPLYRLQRSPS
jgi:hypothetical protein